jgi:hypothetical protein
VLSGVLLLTSHGNTIDFALTLVACASLFVLLLGRGGTARIAVCASVFGLYLLINVVGLVILSRTMQRIGP